MLCHRVAVFLILHVLLCGVLLDRRIIFLFSFPFFLLLRSGPSMLSLPRLSSSLLCNYHSSLLPLFSLLPISFLYLFFLHRSFAVLLLLLIPRT